MSRESTRWEKADISYQNNPTYLRRKSLPYDLSLINLLYVSNFKGGNASIQEAESSINQKLKKYSDDIQKMADRFGKRNLGDLNEINEIDPRSNYARSIRNFLLNLFPNSDICFV